MLGGHHGVPRRPVQHGMPLEPLYRDGLSYLSCDIYGCNSGRPHEMMLEAARLLTDSGRYRCACACELVDLHVVSDARVESPFEDCLLRVGVLPTVVRKVCTILFASICWLTCKSSHAKHVHVHFVIEEHLPPDKRMKNTSSAQLDGCSHRYLGDQ